MRLHHVQLACPPAGEDGARRFWVEGLGLAEVAKPAELAGRGGAWFRAHDPDGAVTLEVHVGVEEGFTPARKAHPAVVLADAAALDAAIERLVALGHEIDHGQADTFPGYRRCHTHDAHGNRVELMAPR